MHAKSETRPPLHRANLTKWALIGASIGLVLISLFLVNAGGADPSWPRFWMVRPLIMVPLAGAAGGIFYCLMEYMRVQYGWLKSVVVLISAIVFIIGLWLGSVLGLDGTYWN